MNAHETPRQLSLLPSSGRPVQFRIDADTRRRGLQHIEEIRRQMAERQAARADVTEIDLREPLRPHHQTAA